MKELSFNTASGKYCCNTNASEFEVRPYLGVSIPQAVSTVATLITRRILTMITLSFNTASGKYCCNHGEAADNEDGLDRFNTASGKYCCNSGS